MELTAREIAAHLNGEVEGNPDLKVSGFARIEQGTPGTLCFLANTKYEEWLYKTKASLVIVNKSFKLKQAVPYTIVWVDDAYRGIAAMLDLYAAANAVKKKGRERPSHVSWRAKVGKDCYIGAFAYISRGAKIGNNVKIFPHVYVGDGVTIGDNSILYSGAKIYAGCHVGKNCILHSSAIIGADGFGFAPDAEKNYKKIPQIGNVVLEDDVEVGANTCIDRATMNSTIIRQGVKLDNLIQLGHNVEIGRNTVIAACAAIAGSTKMGERCMVGGQAGAVGHLHIGNDVMLGAKTGVSNDLADGESRGGWPDMPVGLFRRVSVLLRKLPELFLQVSALEKELKKISENKN
ncbi:MAG: UDP-3-O-(3-hydroxymyristoyl)glucosamine N-acyltransferase [Prevotellaceae bacterium]|jgi:UDP-3-O-[3-hydroxymyristoyl] glucosamine N-acyltransferase|nr:UDP-3-O-(3-hydroxymyristoyl)glucosamine N-acyltransferase [Prevotellaceae bacterium]